LKHAPVALVLEPARHCDKNVALLLDLLTLRVTGVMLQPREARYNGQQPFDEIFHQDLALALVRIIPPITT
jgi:hypothetical protein